MGEALSERLVDDVAAAQPTVAFPHALVREALIAAAGDADSARLHLAIARALEEDPGAEPADLARHYGLALAVAGPEPAIAAYRAAAAAAAAEHDHEQAAAHLRSTLGLLPGSDDAARTSALLELGEQELLSADLVRARQAFGGAGDGAASGDGACSPAPPSASPVATSASAGRSTPAIGRRSSSCTRVSRRSARRSRGWRCG